MIEIRTKKLGALCNVLAGGTPSRSNSLYWNGGIPWVKISDMLQGHIRSTDESISQEGLENSAAKILSKGTLLLSIFATIGRTAVLEIEAATNQAIVGLIPKRSDEVDVGYLRRHLEAQVSSLVRQGRGGAQSNINGAILKDLDIPLPSLDEQKRIAAVLDKADALRRQRQESLQLTEELLQSVFIDMFGDPGANPNGWKIEKLGSLTVPGDSINYGVVQPGGDWLDGVPLVRAGDITNPQDDTSKLKHISPQIDAAYGRSRLKGGEVLIGCVGSVGATCIAPVTWAGANIARAVARVNLRDDIEPEFILQLLRTKALQNYFLDEIRVVAQPTLNIKQIKEAPVILPPAHLREKFSRAFRSAIQNQADKLASDVGLSGFFMAMQQRAFRGELDLSRLTLNADEPASLPLVTQVRTHDGRIYHRPGSFIAPPAIEREMFALEEKFDLPPAEPRPWSENYFKYRTLSQALLPPFSFAQIWEATLLDMEEASYETVKDKVFEYVAAGLLEQRFDEERKEIVFHPRP